MTQKNSLNVNDDSSSFIVNTPNQNRNQEKDQTDLSFLSTGKMSKNVNLIDFVKCAVITEKTVSTPFKNPQYTFDIDKRLTKPQIKKLFETVFNINVLAVNTHIPPSKTVRVGVTKGSRPTYKRAIITLQPNESIKFNLKSLPDLS